jgi:hypothetical protein
VEVLPARRGRFNGSLGRSSLVSVSACGVSVGGNCGLFGASLAGSRGVDTKSRLGYYEDERSALKQAG